jgi:ribosomal protein S20
MQNLVEQISAAGGTKRYEEYFKASKKRGSINKKAQAKNMIQKTVIRQIIKELKADVYEHIKKQMLHEINKKHHQS